MDYTPLTQTLTFVVGDIRQCVNISITSDDVSEINEIFFVNLMSTEADVIVPRANITIVNDGKCALSLFIASTSLTFTVTQTNASNMEFVKYCKMLTWLPISYFWGGWGGGGGG